MECTDEILVIVGAARWVLNVVKFLIPAVLIILGTIDMFKAMTSGDEKETKAAQKKFITRLIYAVVAFLIPFIVQVVFNLAGSLVNHSTNDASSSFTDFLKCWNQATKNVCLNEKGDELEEYKNRTECEDSGGTWSIKKAD